MIKTILLSVVIGIPLFAILHPIVTFILIPIIRPFWKIQDVYNYSPFIAILTFIIGIILGITVNPIVASVWLFFSFLILAQLSFAGNPRNLMFNLEALSLIYLVYNILK